MKISKLSRKERKLKREERRKSEETVMPNGIIALPAEFIYKQCFDCSQVP